MKAKMVLDEARNEEVAVAVFVLHPQLERDIALDARRAQQIRLELATREWVAGPLVDEERRPAPATVFDQRRRIVFPPSRTLVDLDRNATPWGPHCAFHYRSAMRGRPRPLPLPHAWQ